MGARRPGLLGTTTQPEAHRRVRLAGAHRRAGAAGQGVRRPARRRRGLPGRRHGGVPLPARRMRLLVPRGQHPAPGGAPGHRADHGRRPRPAATARGLRWEARGARPAHLGARRRGAPQRRGPRSRLRPRARPDRVVPGPGGARGTRRHRSGRGRRDPGRLRLDDREDHRVRTYPRRRAGEAAPGAHGHHGRHRGRHDQQVVPAGAALPTRGHGGQRGHGVDRPGAHARWSGGARRGRRRAGRRRYRRVRRGRARRAAAVPRHRPRRPAGGTPRAGP